MSIEFEIEENGRYLCFDAYSTHLDLDVGDDVEDSPDRTMAVLEAATVRKLRRFLEYAYPASEDPPHDPDPWEARSGGVPNSGTTATIKWPTGEPFPDGAFVDLRRDVDTLADAAEAADKPGGEG